MLASRSFRALRTYYPVVDALLALTIGLQLDAIADDPADELQAKRLNLYTWTLILHLGSFKL